MIGLKFPSKSPFLPSFEIPVGITTFDNYKKLGDLVLEKEQEILKNNKPYPANDDYNWLTNRLYDYNLFDYSEEYPVLNEFKQFIKNSYLKYCSEFGTNPSECYVNCWANIIRENRTISPHTHSDAHINAPLEYSYVSGNICIAVNNTKTFYGNPFLPKQSIAVKNIPGELILFPSWVNHWVGNNNTPEPRISIAFDIVTEEVYNLPSEQKNNFRKL
jgi:hypothetical protein